MPTLEISDETYQRIKDQLGTDEMFDCGDYDEMVGKAWFFRTITYHIIGKVVGRCGTHLRLEGASWVADSGRFMQAIRDGELSEVEPLGEWYVNLSATTDFGPWVHTLPKEQK